LKYLDMVETTKLYQDMQVDQHQVQRENVMMSQGQPVVPNEFDNIPAHLQGHADYMKTEEFSSLPPEIQQIHLMHYQGTKQQLLMQAQEQMMQSMMMQPPQEEQAPPGQPVSQRNGQSQ